VLRCAIGLIGMGSTPIRAGAAEALAIGNGAGVVDAEAVGRAAVDDLDNVPSDLHGTADYRRKVAAVMVERAFASAVSDARSAA
jgi:carbon-monoxide dehydrogenase medium subunit